MCEGYYCFLTVTLADLAELVLFLFLSPINEQRGADGLTR